MSDSICYGGLSKSILDALGIPPRTRKFTLVCDVASVPVITVEYFPTVDATAVITEKFKLERISE